MYTFVCVSHGTKKEKPNPCLSLSRVNRDRDGTESKSMKRKEEKREKKN